MRIKKIKARDAVQIEKQAFEDLMKASARGSNEASEILLRYCFKYRVLRRVTSLIDGAMNMVRLKQIK